MKSTSASVIGTSQPKTMVVSASSRTLKVLEVRRHGYVQCFDSRTIPEWTSRANDLAEVIGPAASNRFQRHLLEYAREVPGPVLEAVHHQKLLLPIAFFALDPARVPTEPYRDQHATARNG
jgi:hypothetical protein